MTTKKNVLILGEDYFSSVRTLKVLIHFYKLADTAHM